MGMIDSVPRRKREGLTTEAFTRLLGWLDCDRERAGHKYEAIRLRLIRIFVCRGCSTAEELADETFDRVAAKLPEVAQGYVGDPALYFYGVAEKIYMEHRRRAGLYAPLLGDVAHRDRPAETADTKYACLDQCMKALSQANRELILLYYRHERPGKEKIDTRRELAETLGIGANALWIRAHRIRESLRKCVSDCLQRQQPEGSQGN